MPLATDSFGTYLDYYIQRVGLSQNQLAICARITQSRLNKIANGKIRDVPVDILVNLCLALRLNRAEAIDLLARKERAFSPANPIHSAYLELIDIYNKMEFDYTHIIGLTNMLETADQYLTKKKFPSLPNADSG